MDNVTFSLLDYNDAEAVCQYERSLFRAFYPFADRVYERIRIVDMKEKRVRSRIPYTDLDVFVVRWHGSIIAGGAFNYNMNNPLQLEELGFTIDKKQEGICEGLALFNNNASAANQSIMLQLGDHMHARLVEKKIVRTYGTCRQRLLKGYQTLGFRAIDQRDNDSVRHFLLEKEVDPEGPGFHFGAS